MSSKRSYNALPGAARYASLTVPALKALSKERKLRVSGSKTELISRLLNQDVELENPGKRQLEQADLVHGLQDSSKGIAHLDVEMEDVSVPSPERPQRLRPAYRREDPVVNINIEHIGVESEDAHVAPAAPQRSRAPKRREKPAVNIEHVDVELEDEYVTPPAAPQRSHTQKRRAAPTVNIEGRSRGIGRVDAKMVDQYFPRPVGPQLNLPQKRAAEVDDGEGESGAPPASKRKVAPKSRAYSAEVGDDQGEPRAPPIPKRKVAPKSRASNAEIDDGEGEAGASPASKRKAAPPAPSADDDGKDTENAIPIRARKRSPKSRQFLDCFFVNDDDEGEVEEESKEVEKTDFDLIEAMSRRAAYVMREELKTNCGDIIVLSNDVQFVMADLLKFFYRKVMDRAASLAHYTKSVRITKRHVQAALQICMGGGIVNNMQKSGLKRVQEYRDHCAAQHM
eukprot:GEMP01028660.1.p1 GENE.GEMP01028660.1~~GEMP01028660.1.p1  ORF type:complete len:453 (+),score=108.26 GEMP01028660.1:134-1492(+)